MNMLFCLWDGAYKRTLAANWKEYVAEGGFLSRYLNGPLPYVHMTIKKMC